MSHLFHPPFLCMATVPSGNASGSWMGALSLSGDVSIGIKCAPGVVGPVEADIDFDIIKNDNDTFTVKYTPPGPGHYTIMVLFANQVSERKRTFAGH